MTYYFRVTGAADGMVWGTDVYTADSVLAVAAGALVLFLQARGGEGGAAVGAVQKALLGEHLLALGVVVLDLLGIEAVVQVALGHRLQTPCGGLKKTAQRRGPGRGRMMRCTS